MEDTNYLDECAYFEENYEEYVAADPNTWPPDVEDEEEYNVSRFLMRD